MFRVERTFLGVEEAFDAESGRALNFDDSGELGGSGEGEAVTVGDWTRSYNWEALFAFQWIGSEQ